jgi:CRISPR-associated protein Cas1
MIKRTIDISQEAAHISVELDQLQIRPHDDATRLAASIPVEDIGVLLTDHQRNTFTHAALAALAQYQATVIVCGRDHLPAGIMLPMAQHTQVVWRVNEQIEALQRKPLCKQLWTQIVRAKIRGQARNLPRGSPAQRRLAAMVNEVRSGDPSNVEAQAARLYWNQWAASFRDPPPAFRRLPDGADAVNIMLNYGYAIMRAAIARTLVAAGLLPMLGIHHRNRSNAFALADDLVEPLRPMVDQRVRHLHDESMRDLSRTTKAGLLDLLTQTVQTGDESGPLMVALHRMIASLVHCFSGDERDLCLPVLPVPEAG